jgi:hypothetical protein
MALKIRKGTDADRLAITPASGELIYTTDTKQFFVGDGTTVGGIFIGPASSAALTLGGNLTLGGYNIIGTGNINIAGTITATGNINLGNDDADNVVFGGEVNSNIVPNTDVTFGLGTSVKRWNTLHVNSATIGTQTSTSITSDSFYGNIEGSVFDSGSNMMIDAELGRIVGPVFSNVTGNVTGNIIAGDTTTAYNGSTKTFTGSFSGNLTGDSSGLHTGNVQGNVRAANGTVILNAGTNGTDALFEGSHLGDMRGSVFGNDSTPLVDAIDSIINLNGTVNDKILPRVTATHDVGSGVYKFRNLYLSTTLNIGSNSSTITSTDENITLKGNPKSNTTVVALLDGDVTGTSINTFTVQDALGIRSGATFKLPGTALLTVNTVNTGTGEITTTATFTPSGEADDGAEVIFYNPETYMTTYRHVVPTSATGEPGDLKGMVFATTDYIYMCKADYDGASDIWVVSATTTWPL